MLAALVFIFIVVPLSELYVIVQVAHSIGAFNTLAVLFLVSLVGAWLVKREGIGVLRKAQAKVDAGQVPGKELADGVLILLGGALLLVPGFITDAIGVLLLLPPVRAAMRALLIRRYARRAQAEIVVYQPRRYE